MTEAYLAPPLRFLGLEAFVADKDNPRPTHTEHINPAPWLGRVGDGATSPSGEYISREIRELTERARAYREQQEREKKRHG
jgi:hypothetical protein